MAQSKETKIAVLQRAGVKLTGEETVKELDALIKQHLNVDADETPENKEVSKPAAKKRGSAEIAFVLRDGEKRTFSEADHGENFADVADEFHETNKHRVIRRLDDGVDNSKGKDE